MELETVNKLYLELSRVATAKTARELLLEDFVRSKTEGRQVAVAEPMPGAPGFTIAVFKAEDIPAGSVVWTDPVTSNELLKG